VTSVFSATSPDHQAHIDRLQSRLEALEYENERLRLASDTAATNGSHDASASNDALQEQCESLTNRVSSLEAQLQTACEALDDRGLEVSSLRSTVTGLEQQKEEDARHLKELTAKAAESVASATYLKEIIEQKETKETEHESLLVYKDSEITRLEVQVEKLSSQFEEERQDLTRQVDELRQAGQVCASYLQLMFRSVF
jgi:CAP-Gly domain-containing linker protein 1